MRGISWLSERTLCLLRRTLLHGVSFSLVIISRIVKWEGHVASMGENSHAYKIIVRTHQEKKSVGTLRYIWGIISINFDLNRGQSHEVFANTAMNLGFYKRWGFCDYLYRRTLYQNVRYCLIHWSAVISFRLLIDQKALPFISCCCTISARRCFTQCALLKKWKKKTVWKT
jgi:hypothetical protein